jgi:pilus assembly protein Flp/PilA
MKALIRRVRLLAAREDGPTTVEYAVMLTLIVCVAIAAITVIGTKVAQSYSTLESSLPDGSG